MPRTADFRVLAGLDLDVLGCPDFGAALAHERKLVAARHALVAVRSGLIAVEVRCRETADQNDGVEHDRFISRVGQPTGQRHWFVASSRSKVRRPALFIGKSLAPSAGPGKRRASTAGAEYCIPLPTRNGLFRISSALTATRLYREHIPTVELIPLKFRVFEKIVYFEGYFTKYRLLVPSLDSAFVEPGAIAVQIAGCDLGALRTFSVSTTSTRSRAYPFPLSMAVRAIAPSKKGNRNGRTDNPANRGEECVLETKRGQNVSAHHCGKAGERRSLSQPK